MAFAGCATGRLSQPSTGAERPTNSSFTAEVTQGSDGTWTVTYEFDRARNALLFDFAGHRTTQWHPSSPGTTIENLDGLDVLLADPAARSATFVVAPEREIVETTQPFLQFSDGSVALHVGQFSVLTVANRSEAAALQGSLRDWHGTQPTVQLTVKTHEPMLLPDGKRVDGTAQLAVRGGGGYVYVGKIRPVETDDFITVTDPGLPAWLARRFNQDLERVYAAHRSRWGVRAERAVVLLAFGGVDDSEATFTNKGFAAGAQLSMTIRGKAYSAENEDALRDLLWFFAHEAAHQFQFRDQVSVASGDEWISEGAANTMAIAALHDLGMMGTSLMERRYWETHRDCARDLAEGPIRGSHGRTSYVCGDLIAEMTAAALPDHDLYAFWNALRDAAIEHGRHKLTGEGYFELLRKRGAPDALVDRLERLVTQRLEHPADELADAMKASGLQPRFAGDGGLSTMLFPAVAASK